MSVTLVLWVEHASLKTPKGRAPCPVLLLYPALEGLDSHSCPLGAPPTHTPFSTPQVRPRHVSDGRVPHRRCWDPCGGQSPGV